MLVLLPIVVAVVVTLVKHSVALAFSLGGIVGAVAFRHRLQDTKDAIYTFVAIAVGLAVGVQAYSVAFAASLFFNLVVMALWLTDFARVPGHLIPSLAARRVKLAKEIAPDRRSTEYVTQLDELLLQSMTPDQLKALADRALERNEAFDANEESGPRGPGGFRTSLEIRAPADQTGGVRATAEAVLRSEAKRWEFDRVEGAVGDPSVTLHYLVSCRKKAPAPLLAEQLREALKSLGAEVSIR
jgi:hypothetical protein